MHVPAKKSEKDPEKGTVVLKSAAVFGDKEKTVLPLNYINMPESGSTYNNAGIYDRTFSLDARDARTSSSVTLKPEPAQPSRPQRPTISLTLSSSTQNP